MPTPLPLRHCFLLLVVWLMTDEVLAQHAQLRLPAIFGDQMVLQREKPIRVWGWASPGDSVRVTLAAVNGDGVADSAGAWLVELPPQEAGGPHSLTVVGRETVTFRDVLIGDVWLAGGQSNMEWPVIASNDAEAVMAAANDAELRLFTVERGFAAEPAHDIASAGWHLTTPSTVRDFSAIAYHFGAMLRREVGVPIGLVESNWGGSAAEAWMSVDKLAEHPDFADLAQRMQRGAASPETLFEEQVRQFETELRAWSDTVREMDAGYTIEGAVWAHPSFTPADWDTMMAPQAWEEAGLPDFNGIVWFRKSIPVPPGWNGRPARLHLGLVDDADSTWINGVLIGGEWQYGPRSYDVPAGVLREGENTITIRVIDQFGPGGLRGEPADMWIELAENDADRLSLAGDWAYRATLPLGALPPRPQPPGEHQIPAGLHNAMIAPIRSFGLKGVIWYQGETNAGRAYQYRTLFPALIEDWRTQFESPELPFLFVQLANFMAPQRDPDNESAWAELREAQTMALQVPNTAMAVAIDVGDANDIHPRDKKTVGDRLARAALATVYGRDVVYSGPQYVGMRVDGETIRLLFAHRGSGLISRNGPLTGFAIAGPDGRFRWAEARIDGNSVVVWHPQIDDPRAVRYGWADNPPVNLYNREGLPALPFRTDDLPGITQPQ